SDSSELSMHVTAHPSGRNASHAHNHLENRTTFLFCASFHPVTSRFWLKSSRFRRFIETSRSKLRRDSPSHRAARMTGVGSRIRARLRFASTRRVSSLPQGKASSYRASRVAFPLTGSFFDAG